MRPVMLRETLIQMCRPTLTLPIVYTVYQRGHAIGDPVHRVMSAATPDFDFCIVAEIDLPFLVGRLSVFQGVYWVGLMEGQGDDYHVLLGELRGAVSEAVNALFPADAIPDQDE